MNNLTPANTILKAKAHYPFPMRLLIELFNAGELPNIDSIALEPTYGYAGRLVYKNGSIRMLRGNNIDINPHGASEISKDKGYSKYFLQKLGYNTSLGQVFLSSEYINLIDGNLSRYGFENYANTQKLFAYIEDVIKYPCFIKPNEGSQGQDVFKCYTADDVYNALAKFAEQCLPRFIVEQTITLPDYRVVVFEDTILACYQRRPLAIIGDGQSTIRALLIEKQQAFQQAGRTTQVKFDDPRIHRQLNKHNYTFETILPKNQRFEIYEFANLSTGGDAEDFTDRIHPHWQNLCRQIVRDMGLIVCGVDIACGDIESSSADYSIIEINATPGMHNFYTLGTKQANTVRNFYRTVFNRPK